MKTVSLDELYRMTAFIYSEQNAIRPVAATFSHFVEVCGMLTIHDRRKKKEGLDFVDALCKALGWYFPLLAKLRIRSVEELIFRKYPYVCPYCRRAPHEDGICKSVRGTESTVNHSVLREFYERNRPRIPKTLDEWQLMFQVIYPRSTDDRARSTLGLFEELGELAEAVRVFDRYPKYFAGEAADTFSYLMGIANEHNLRLQQDGSACVSLHDEYLKRFPGLCIGCGNRICVCPSIPRSTVGRMAKELDIETNEQLIERSDEVMLAGGREAASSVLQSVGGYKKLTEGFPTDRGDANTALIALCTRLAAAVEKTNPTLGDRFLGAAIELGSAPADAGSKHGKEFLSTHDDLLAALKDSWRSLQAAPDLAKVALSQDSLAFNLGASLAKVRILFVYASPMDSTALRVSGELRAIQRSIKLAGRGTAIEVDDLPSATIDDLRHALMERTYEIVHFAGHSNSDSIILESTEGKSVSVALHGLADLLKEYPEIRCVVLNACDSLAQFDTHLAPYTVGMEKEIDDDSAVEFSRGFYDAICRGKSVEFAVGEGNRCATLKGFENPPSKLLKMPAETPTSR
jgi:NTP pyrophosphatase (non-canonical NTP hydrolase)